MRGCDPFIVQADDALGALELLVFEFDALAQGPAEARAQREVHLLPEELPDPPGYTIRDILVQVGIVIPPELRLQ